MIGISKILSNSIFSKTVKYNRCSKTFIKHISNQFERQFVIVTIKPKDYDLVLNLFRYSYFNSEPTMVAAGLAYKNNPMLDNIILERMSLGTSLMALCRKTGSIVGAAVNAGVCPWDPDLTDEFARTCTCPKLAGVMKLHAHISRANNLWEKFKEHKIFEIMYIATDINNRGKGIGYQLIDKSIELGRDLTYNVVKINAMSAYMQKICQKLKMHKVYDSSYRLYVDRDGKPIFLPEPPHNLIQIYVALPHATPAYQKKLLAR